MGSPLAPHLAAASCVGMQRDAAPRSIPPALAGAPARPPDHGPGGVQAHGEGALPRRSRGPLPARRRLVLQARQRRPGRQAALLQQLVHGRLEDRPGPERLERRRPLQRVDGRRDRLVPQGLHAARLRRRAALGAALRVGQLPHDGLAQRRADRPEHRRLHPVRVPARPLQAHGHEPARRAGGLAPAHARLPARGPDSEGVPTGGWWNYSGIQREVYLEKLDEVDFQKVLVRPILSCATCPASVQMAINLKNVDSGTHRLHITGKFGDRKVDLGTKSVAGKGITAFTDTLHIDNPKLWSPQSPNLYDVSFTVRDGDRKVGAYTLESGIRSIKVVNGRLVLNGQFLNARGLGLHEDSKADGFAINDARRDELMNDVKELGATVIRTHYPLHPVHARARRQARHPDLERDPGLQRQDRDPQGTLGAPAGGQGARQEHRRQREPPVGDALVDRQRALLAARPGPGRLHQRRGQVREGDGPDAPGRAGRRRLPELALPGRAVQVARRPRSQRLLRLVPGARAPRSSTARSSPPTSTPPAPATRTRR